MSRQFLLPPPLPLLLLLLLLVLLPPVLSSIPAARVWTLSWSGHKMVELDTVPAASRTECGVRCARRQGCSATAYKSTDTSHTCRLLGCEAGWQAFDSSCYWLETTAKTWVSGFFDCVFNKRANYTSILSAAENAFVKSLADSRGVSRLHLGLRRDEDGDTWQDRSPVGYTNWADGEGDDPLSDDDDDDDVDDDDDDDDDDSVIVASMMASEGGAWADNSSDGEFAYVCKRGRVLP